jgi:hypothetical protein
MKLFNSLILCSVALTGSSAWAKEPAPHSAPLVERPDVAWFLSPSLRVQGTLSQVNAAPAVEVGARFAFLKVGFSMLYRSAAWSSQRIPFELPQGLTYKGKSELELGIQHGWFGLMLAPEVYLDDAEQFALEFPVTAGASFLGSPLMGEDRVTPDGRRVSDWENELLSNADFGFGYLFDFGIRARFAPKEVSWLHFVLGGHYSVIGGFDNYAAEKLTLSGPGASIGVSFAP